MRTLTVRHWELAEEETAWNSPDTHKIGHAELGAVNQAPMG